MTGARVSDDARAMPKWQHLALKKAYTRLFGEHRDIVPTSQRLVRDAGS